MEIEIVLGLNGSGLTEDYQTTEYVMIRSSLFPPVSVIVVVVPLWEDR